MSKVRGRFNTFDIDVVIGDTLESTALTATIDVASIDTGNADRDAHVLSPDILDVARRPTLVFRSTRVTDEGEHFAIEGDLTIGEITHPVTLTAELGGVETFPVVRVTRASKRRRRSSARTSTSTSRSRPASARSRSAT